MDPACHEMSARRTGHATSLPVVLCSFFFNKDPFLKSPLMIFLRSLAFFEARPSKCLCNFAPLIVFDVFSTAMDFAVSISLMQIIASIGRLALEDTSLLKFFRQVRKFPKFPNASTTSFSGSFFFEAESSTTGSNPSTGTLQLQGVA